MRSEHRIVTVRPRSCQFLTPSGLNMTIDSTIESKVSLFEVSLCSTGSILIFAQYFLLATGNMFKMLVMSKETSFVVATPTFPIVISLIFLKFE